MESVDTNRHAVELLGEEFAARIRQGEAPAIEEYAAAHPDLESEIRELFPTIAALESLRRKKEQPADGKASLGSAKLKQLGDFRIIREIGRGGMGVVYEAEQESLARSVAVKVLPKQSLLDEKHLRRFQREARTCARLHHTNIVPILAVGVHDDYHYYAMQMIDGVGLDEVIAKMAADSCHDVSASKLSQLWRRFHSDTSLELRPDASEPAPNSCTPGSEARPSADPTPKTSPSTLSGAADPASLAGPPVAGDATLVDLTAADLTSDSIIPEPLADGSQAVTDPTVPESSRTLLNCASSSPPRQEIIAPATSTAKPCSGSYWNIVADVGIQAANALHYAHEHGVLHRDIKPGNLIFDASGIVWVADFGLAKAMEQDEVSRTGDIVGTLRFMAPEQLRGEADARSDIYSLGLTLYELLTLHSAHRDNARKRALVTGEAGNYIIPPRKHNPQIPRDLETIVLKAIAESPSARYQDAADFADDLMRFVQDRPISARRAGPFERLWRWGRRNPALAMLTTVAIFLLAMVAVTTTVGYVRIQSALAEESIQRQRTESALGVSLYALDRVYQRFAPDRILVAPVSFGESTSEESFIELPAQMELSQETAELLKDLLASYNELAALDSDNLQIQSEVAKANRRLGDIYQQLDDRSAAKISYEQAVMMYTQLIARTADITMSGPWKTERARILNELGSIYRRSGSFNQADRVYQDALAGLEELTRDFDAPEAQYELARTHYLLSGASFGAPFLRSGLHGPARPRKPFSPTDGDSERTAERMRDLRRRWEQSSPKPGPPTHRPEGPEGNERRQTDDSETPDTSSRRATASSPPADSSSTERKGPPKRWPPSGSSSRSNFLRSLVFRPLRPDQKKHLELAVDLLTQLKTAHPSVPEYSRMLALCYREQFRGGDAEGLQRSIAVLGKLVDEYPQLEKYKYDLAMTLAADAIDSAAPEQLRKALTLARGLNGQTPAYANAQADFCSALASANTRLRAGEPDADKRRQLAGETTALLQEAVAVHRTQLRKSPNSNSHRARLTHALEMSAHALQGQNAPDSLALAAQQLAEAAGLMESILSSSEEPVMRRLHWPIAKIYENLASCYDRLEDETQAAAARAASAEHMELGKSQRGGFFMGRGPRGPRPESNGPPSPRGPRPESSGPPAAQGPGPIDR